MSRRPTTVPEEAGVQPWQQSASSLEIGSSIDDLGDPQRIAKRAAETGLSHVVIKVADGTKAHGAKEQVTAVCRALARFYERACQRIEGIPELVKEREHLDGDLDDLVHLVKGITTISTSQLSLLKTYTINFNPAEDITALNLVRTALPAQ